MDESAFEARWPVRPDLRLGGRGCCEGVVGRLGTGVCDRSEKLVLIAERPKDASGVCGREDTPRGRFWPRGVEVIAVLVDAILILPFCPEASDMLIATGLLGAAITTGEPFVGVGARSILV